MGNTSFDSIMSGWTTASEFVSAAAFVLDSKAKADRAITRLAASSIKLALDEVQAGRPGTSVEANVLLHFCAVYRKKEAQMLRAYLINYGPFVAAPESVMLTVGDKREALDKSCAVKFNAAKCKKSFAEKTPEQYAQAADAVNFATWKAAMKAEDKAGEEKSEEQTKAELKVKLQKRIEKALAEAKEADIELDIAKPEKEVVKVRKATTFDGILDLVSEASADESLTEQERNILTAMADLALSMYVKAAA